MQVVDHITTCPLLNQERGLEPYPQPVVCFNAAIGGTAQVRIYDTSVQPMVELTTTALSGAELSAVTATGLTYAYTLDMGHANVTSVVDLMNREGFEGIVMFEDSGGTGEKIYVKISANTPEQVAFLYPDNAVYLDRGAATSATTFPNGSIFKPVNLIADACSLVTSRGADVLDVVGNFTPSTDEWTHAKIGTTLEGKQIRCRPGNYSIIQSHDNTGLRLDRCHIKGSNHNLSLRNDTNNDSGFWGGIFVEDCSLWGFGSNGYTSVHPVIRDCLIERFCDGAGNPPVWIDCEFGTLGSIDIGDYSNHRYARFVRPSGAKLSLVGNYQGSTRYLNITDVKGMLPIELSIAIRNGVNITITGAYGDLQIDGLAHAQPPVVTTSKLAGLDDLTGGVVTLATGSITPIQAPNLDVAVSSVAGGGAGGVSSIEVVDHIRTCPLLNQERGLEPYPQPLVTFSSGTAGQVSARIFDTSVEPVVELTSTALTGSEIIFSSSAGGASYNLDMGHGNVTGSVVNVMNREGFEGLVLFTHTNNLAEVTSRYVKVTCNDPDHVRELYPDNAVYLSSGSAASGTSFPVGSIFQPASLIADACSLMTSRKADILDISGEFSPNHDEPTRTKLGTALQRKIVRCRPGNSAILENPSNPTLDVDLCFFQGNNKNMTLKNGNSGGFAGAITVEDCVMNAFRTSTSPSFAINGTGATRPKIINCQIEALYRVGTNQPDDFFDCEFVAASTLSIGSVHNNRAFRLTGTRGILSVGGAKTAGSITLSDCKGMLDVEFSSQINSGVNINVSGDYGSLVVNGAGNTVTENQTASKALLEGGIVTLATGSITPIQAPNLDVAVSSVAGGGGGSSGVSSIEVIDHIRVCPLLNQVRGLEPYPQPLVTFSSASASPVSVNIFDTSVQPPVELTSTALTGAEVLFSSSAGEPSYILDMGHGNVTGSVVDVMNREGFEGLVMFSHTGSSGAVTKKYVKVTCNDSDHVALLYPDNAIYLQSGSVASGSSFPVGSIYKPASLIADACSMMTSREAEILDIAGEFSPTHDEPTAAKLGAHLVRKRIRCRPGQEALFHCEDSTFLDLDFCSWEGSDKNLKLQNGSSAGTFGGRQTTTDVVMQQVRFHNSPLGNSRPSDRITIHKNCKQFGNYFGGGPIADFIDCEFAPGGQVALGYNSYRNLTYTRPSGELTLGGNKTAGSINISDAKGQIPIEIGAGIDNTIINVAGDYGTLTINGTGNTVTENKSAAFSDLSAGVVTLATGSITPIQAPNLDVAVSSVTGSGGGSGDWTTTEKDQIRHRLSLDGNQSNPTGSTGDFENVIITNLDQSVSSLVPNIATNASMISDVSSSLESRLTVTRANNLDNLDASISSIGGTQATVEVVDHIRTCPLLNQERGLEPYPQPLVTFSSASSGPVSVNIFDTSVQPPVELTSTALTGPEVLLSSSAGESSYILDMGHGNVTGSVVDVMNREGFEGLVMFSHTGSSGAVTKKYVKVTCNDSEHVKELYPDNAIYLDRGAATSATTFPNGSIFRPVNLVADACTLMTSRQAAILDVKGEFTASTDEFTNAKVGTSLAGKTVRCRAGNTAKLENKTSGMIQLDKTFIQGFNKNLTLEADTNNNLTAFNGEFVVDDCKARFLVVRGTVPANPPILRNCTIDQTIQIRSEPPIFTDCEFQGNSYVDFNTVSAPRNPKFIRPTGARLSCVGSYTNGTIDVIDCQGFLPVSFTIGFRYGVVINVSGAYSTLTVPGLTQSPPAVVTENKLSGYNDLTGGIVTLATGSITPIQAPNLDVAVSSVTGSGGGGGGDWTATEKSQIRSRLSLDGTQIVPSSTSGALYDLITRLTEGRATNLDLLDQRITTAVSDINAQQSTTDAKVDTVLTRIGTDDIAILKGMLLGNFVLDGGAGVPDISYDANGHAATQRIRVFASAAATTAATKGAANGADSEIARVDVTSQPVSGKGLPKNVTGTLT